MSDWSPGDGDDLRYALNDLDRLRAAERRVRKLHDGYTDRSDEHRVFCVDCNVEYPCSTIKALDGEINE